MRRLIVLVSTAALLVAAPDVSASPVGRPVWPYAKLSTPAEAVSSVAGGYAVPMTEQIKSRVVIEPYTGGGGCGLAPPMFETEPEQPKPPTDPEADSAKTRLYLLGGVGVGVLLLLAWLLLRR